MTKRTQSGSQRKKTLRLNALKKRQQKHAQLFEAVDRRRRLENSRLAAARGRLRSNGLSSSTLERRRQEYVEIPKPEPSAPLSRAILGTIAIAFLLPLFVAMSSNFLEQWSAKTFAIANHARPHVVSRIYSRPPNVVSRISSRQPRPTVALQIHSRPLTPNVVSRISSRPRSTKPIVTSRFVASVLEAVFGVSSPPQKPLSAKHIAPPQSTMPAVPAKQPSSPWTISPDGTWVAVVHAPASMSDVTFSTSTGQLIELEHSSVASDAATVTIGWARPVIVTISSPDQTLTKTLEAPDASAEAFDATAAPVGPHLVNVGWTPLAAAADVSGYEVFRSTDEGERPALIATLPASEHTLHDTDVAPDSHYRYTVVAETTNESIQASTPAINTPAALSGAAASDVGGKGMFLYFSSLVGDPRNFHHYDPADVVAEAQRAGIHVIELRMARGACTMAQTEEAHAWLDRLIDSATAANIKLLAWTVPRRASTQDLAETIAAAAYTTPSGNGFEGLALDLETGDNYMGDGSSARESMVEYIRDVRLAAGPHYLIVATVASPRMGFTNDDYPYARIARYADVLQPMEYWHYFDEAVHHEYARSEVAGAAVGAVARTRELAGRDIPVDVAGQSVDLEGTGAPSGREILWSLGGAKSVGAIGETFFDWAGTRPDAWAAIQAFDW